MLLDYYGRVVLEVVAEAVIDRDEKPAVIAARHQRGADGPRDCLSIESVMDRGCGAGFVAEALGDRRAQRNDLMSGACDRLDDQRLRRAGDIHDRIDMLVLEPVARDRRGAVGAVLMVGDEDLDRRAE